MTDILTRLNTILAEVNALPDRELGGPAAPTARANIRRVANHLSDLHARSEPLARHAGKASTGKVAAAISKDGNGNFNRQNFFTNAWCGKLLELYDAWELRGGLSGLDAAAAAAEAKQPRDDRVARLEEELLVAQAEARQLRQEVAFLRGFMATTGRVP